MTPSRYMIGINAGGVPVNGQDWEFGFVCSSVPWQHDTADLQQRNSAGQVISQLMYTRHPWVWPIPAPDYTISYEIVGADKRVTVAATVYWSSNPSDLSANRPATAAKLDLAFVLRADNSVDPGSVVASITVGTAVYSVQGQFVGAGYVM